MSDNHRKTVLITGATGGIGLHSAIGIAKTGARVLISGRNATRGAAAQDAVREASGNEDVLFVQGNVSSNAGVDQLAEATLAHVDGLDTLVNNAGFLGSEYLESHDGVEMHFAVNVLAPWRLTQGLLPALQAAPNARVINVSGGDKPARIDPDNLQAEKGFRGLMTYTHSKSILEALSIHMAEVLEPIGVTVNVVFPGRASTAMTRSLSPKALPGPMKLMYPFFRLFFRDDGGRSAERASRSTVWAATSPDLIGVTGAYFDTNAQRQPLHPTAHDPDVHARICAVLHPQRPPLSRV